ncbi:MAG: hypothetical protein H7330_01225, partial [Hymenobacteraceae bacterium]|nr:hypothetical protein [Hymenobacteraceae bacterium]
MIRSTDQGPGTWTGGLAFYVNGAGFAQRRHSIEVMRLTNNKVGIGTAAPIGKLHLVTDNSNGGSADNYLFDSYGDNADEGLFLRKASGTVAAPQNLQAGDRIGTLSFVPRVNNLPPAYFTGSQIHAYYLGDGTNALSDLRFYTSGQNERMRVSETGNVGIGGAVSPITRLTLTPFSTEPKITLWNGGNIVNHFGFGVSSNQLNYHVFGATDNHVFFAGGRNGDGVELLRITGTGGVRVAGLGGGGQRLFTVDNAGNLVAATSPPTGQGDNLGDHTATQNLNLAT